MPKLNASVLNLKGSMRYPSSCTVSRKFWVSDCQGSSTEKSCAPKLLKEYEINTYSKPLGRPPKKERPPEYYRKMAKASGTETKSNAPSAPAREYTEPTT